MTFSYTTNVRAHAGVTPEKIKTNKRNQNNVCHLPFTMFVRLFVFPYAFPIRFVYLFIFLFYKCLSYTFCLVFRFNCIKRAVFKPLIFPAYSINIVIVIFDKWPPLLSDLSQCMICLSCLFYLCQLAATRKCKGMK